MLQRLFQQTGFGWGVRISGFISGAGCMVATILTTSVPQPKRVDNWSGVKALTDVRFVLLTAGSCFVAFGKHPSLFLFLLPFANLVLRCSLFVHELKLLFQAFLSPSSLL